MYPRSSKSEQAGKITNEICISGSRGLSRIADSVHGNRVQFFSEYIEFRPPSYTRSQYVWLENSLRENMDRRVSYNIAYWLSSRYKLYKNFTCKIFRNKNLESIK